VVVLPESWSQWPAAQLDAVLTHEHEHARRRDPLFQWLALLNRAVFWPHPLAWWLERRMAALAEEACDAVVLAHGHDPRDYSKYLIDMARSVATNGARIQVWGMAMPGGFLEQRIRRILEGGPMPRLSRPRLVGACIACAATSAAFATSTLDHQRPARQPFQAARSNGNPAVPLLLAQIQPQAPTFLPVPAAIPDAPGVTVSGADRILHRAPVEYPAEARAKGIEGTVTLDLTLAPDGTVSDAAVVAGPMELRRATLSAVLKWHFSQEAAPRQQVSVEFKLSEAKAAAAREVQVMAPPPTAAPSASTLTDVPRTLRVDIQGLSPEAAAELRQRLALREGEVFDHAAFVKELERIHQIVTEFDPHLSDSNSRTMTKVSRKAGADGKALPPDSMDAVLIISPRNPAPQGTELQQYSKIAKPPSLENVPIKLHVDIQGLSPESTAELRQRLALQEGETTDIEALRNTLARIRQVVREFDPRLKDEGHIDYPPNMFGADGKPVPGTIIEAPMVIKPTVPK
jgi:TonB family protein